MNSSRYSLLHATYAEVQPSAAMIGRIAKRMIKPPVPSVQYCGEGLTAGPSRCTLRRLMMGKNSAGRVLRSIL